MVGIRRVNLYNEIDPFAARWIETLVERGHLPPGRVDRRSIADLCGVDLDGATQVHLFAGIGGWPLALDLAGWPRDLPVWTGSCPCQPFSSAGARKGFADEKHLWPEFFRLIRDRAPAFVFGEQVASRDGLAWLDVVSNDLEGAGYAFRAVDLAAGGLGAPHKRSRLFFVAIADHERRDGLDDSPLRSDPQWLSQAARSGALDGAVGDPYRDGAGRLRRGVSGPEAPREGEGLDARDHAHESFASGLAGAAWGDGEWIPCADGRARLTRSGALPLAHGIPARVGRLRGYGNAIVPQVAAVFVRSVLECFG